MNVFKYNPINTIYLITFLDLLAVGLIFPLLSSHVRSLGASHFTIGLLGSIYSGLQIFSGPIIGSWSDVRGHNAVLRITLSISATCYLLMGLSASVSIIFVLRLVLGVAKHTQTLSRVLLTNYISKERIVEVFSNCASLGSLGFVLGPIIGGHISELNNGFFYICCLTSVVFVVNIGLSFNIPSSSGKVNRKRTDSTLLNKIATEFFKTFYELKQVDWNSYWDAFLLRFLFAVSTSIFFSHQAMYLEEKFELSKVYIGYSISFLSTVGVVFGFLLGRVSKILYKDKNDLVRIFHAFILYAFSFLGLHFAPNIYLFILILIPFSISNITLRIVSMELILTRSAKRGRGSLSGASNSIMSLARCITPLSTGILSTYYGENCILISGFLFSLIGIILSACLNYRRKEIVKYKSL